MSDKDVEIARFRFLAGIIPALPKAQRSALRVAALLSRDADLRFEGPTSIEVPLEELMRELDVENFSFDRFCNTVASLDRFIGNPHEKAGNFCAFLAAPQAEPAHWLRASQNTPRAFVRACLDLAESARPTSKVLTGWATILATESNGWSQHAVEAIAERVERSPATVRKALANLVEDGVLVREMAAAEGLGRWWRYRLPVRGVWHDGTNVIPFPVHLRTGNATHGATRAAPRTPGPGAA